MRRRELFGTALAGALAYSTGALAHTPYKQWQIYRRKHLLVGCQKDQPDTYALAKSLVSLFEAELPRASARVARAPHAQRIASLMATDQLDTAIVPTQVAADMAAANNQFAAYGKVPLRLLFCFDDLLMVGLESMPEHHAVMIHDAIRSAHTAADKPEPVVPWHAAIVEHKS